MINAHEHTVAEVLGDGFLHEIPPYQRPYAWTSDEALQLLEDLDDAASVLGNEPYFLGSIVLIRPLGQVDGQVVDGQQRLTTLTILAAVLRDIADDSKEHEALANAVYIEPNPFKAQTEAIRVRAHIEDNVFFREAIQMPGATAKVQPAQQWKTEAQALMWGNSQKIRDRVLQMSTFDRQRLVAFLLNKCMLVVVTTDSRSSALRIFRVLNDRGLDLSNADVIKADLLEKFGATSAMSHQAARWRGFEADLGRQGFEGLLEALRFINEQGKNRRTLSEAYNDRFHKTDAKGVQAFLDDELAPAKKWIAEITEGDAEEFAEASRSSAFEALAGLRLLPNKDWLPVALAAAMRFGANEHLIAVLEKLEGLAWVLQLGKRYDTQRMNRYAEIVRCMNQEESKLLDAMRLTDDEVQDACSTLSGPLYTRFPVRVVRAILERLDRLLAEQPVAWSGTKTVEHILPQNPAEGAWDYYEDAHRETSTHYLGNLVLLTGRKNSSASNLSFNEKRAVYFGLSGSSAAAKRATYASAQELSHLAAWNFDSFNERHNRHLKLLKNRWGLQQNSPRLVKS